MSSTFEALERLADLLAKAPEPRVLVETSLDAALGPLGLTRGGLYLRRPDAPELVLEAQRGLPQQVVQRRGRQPIADKGTGLAGVSAHTMRPATVLHMAKEPASSELHAAFREAGVEASSAAAVPVVIDGRTIGVILVVSEAPRDFTHVDLAYLRLVGALLGATLTGQRALREQSETNEELGALTAALEQRTAELKQLDKHKAQLIHMITHELRKPLAPIFTYSDMLLGMEFPPDKQKQFLQHIRSAADEMNHYITEMINAAKLEEGAVQILYSDVDVAEVVRMAVGKLNAEAEAAHLAVAFDAHLPRKKYTTDGVKITEIVENLLDNAIKYTPEGGRVGVRLREAGGTLEIAITDTGIGIPADEIPKLFQKFATVQKAAPPRPTHRAGLGLYLAKVYAEAIGGTLAVQSELGKGSTFTLKVPVGA